MADAAPRTVTLSRRATFAVAAVVVLLLALLAGQFVFIVQQRGLIDSQLAVAKRQEDRARPVLGTADALLGTPRDALAAARRAGDALRTLQRVLDSVQHDDLVDVAASALRRAPELIAAVDHAVGVLDRTYPTLRDSLAVQRESLAVQRESLGLLQQSFGVQRSSLARLTEALGVARATLTHAESIDRKTGGQVPPVVP
jgi:hypothetical protein